jgi:hypothetical protein
VADLYLVVDLAAIADLRIVQRPRSMVVLAPISTSLPMITRPICGIFTHCPIRGKTEAVGADHRTGMQDDTFADPAIVIDGDIGIKRAAIADLDTIADHATGMNLHALAQYDIPPILTCAPMLAAAGTAKHRLPWDEFPAERWRSD